MSATAPAPDELRLAATWLEHYEAHPNGEGAAEVASCRKVAAMLHRQADAAEARAREAEVVARAAAESGRTPAECRAALRRILARNAGR